MVHTVGIIGVNGNVGAPTARLLIKAAEEGKIKLVIFHRAGSSTKDLKEGPNVEKRVLSLEDPPEKIEAAVKGVNVLLSAVGVGALATEANVVDALARSRDLVTYISPVFSTTWTKSDAQDPQLGQVLGLIHQGWDRAKDKGVGLTILYTGVFDLFWFQIGFLGAPIKANTICANQRQLQNRLPISTLDHVASVLARIATSDPETVKNKEYSAVTFWPTGHELVDLYTKLNGKQAQVKPWTDATRTETRADPDGGLVRAGYWDHWEADDWEYESGGKIVDKEYDGPGLEEVARGFLERS